VRVLAVGEPERLQGDAALARGAAQAAGVAIEAWHSGAELVGVLVDALLGTGFRPARCGSITRSSSTTLIPILRRLWRLISLPACWLKPALRQAQ